MKKGFKNVLCLSSLMAASAFSITACKPAEVVINIGFSFSVSTTVKGVVYMDQEGRGGDQIRIIESKNKGDKTQRVYRYYLAEPSDEQYLEVDQNGYITPIKLTPKKGDPVEGQDAVYEDDYEVGIEIYEEKEEMSRYLYLKVKEKFPEADGGYNFSSDSEARTEILGKLEEYAMSNFLTGISLFENGGYVRYSPRVNLPTDSYITGFGFGLLSEGDLHKPGTSWLPDVAEKKDYYRSATSSDPLTINAWNATGSQVSDLNGYISSSLWGTKIDPEDTTKYAWYPILAADTCPDPVAIDAEGHELRTEQDFEDAGKSIFKTWRVYVKTNEITYRTPENASASMKAKFDGRAVQLKDYEFVYKMLLTGATKLKRGTELASDTSYGIKGGYAYNMRTASYTGASQASYDAINDAWNSMKANGTLGIKTSDDIVGYTGDPYIQFELLNPIDQFTAKYTLSSNLYSPLPEEFLAEIGGNISDVDASAWEAWGEEPGHWVAGAAKFGTFDGNSIDNRILCLGPYHLDIWNKGQETAFKRSDRIEGKPENTKWFEITEDRYKIPGVHIRVVEAATQKPDAIYQEFLQNKLDATGIPSSRMNERLGTDLPTKGDSTFKLNVNSCTQERWNELNEEIFHNTTAYKVKPFMSNYNFLNGLFWSINREVFANKRGVTPSYNYFSDAYLSDPKSGESYNSTDAHKAAVEGFGIDLSQQDYGYSKSKAIKFFRDAVNELASTGAIKLGSSASNPTRLRMDIQWMYPSDEYEYGQDIGNDIMDAFNDSQVCGGRVKLTIKHAADQQWEQVYNDHLMVGKYDLGFGAISGNSLNPLNFLEVLRSDNSSGFTLNWGADTSKFDERNPINYAGKEWSFDSLWASADHGSIVSEGLETKTVKTGYIDTTKSLDGSQDVSDFRDGVVITAPFKFVEVEEGASFNIERIQLFLVGAGTFSIDPSQIELLNAAGQVITDESTDKVVAAIRLTFTAADAQTINDQIFNGNKYQKAIDKLSPSDPDYDRLCDEYHHKFTRDNYYSRRNGRGMWIIEVYYSVHIAGSEETESEYDILKNESDDPNAKYVLKF